MQQQQQQREKPMRINLEKSKTVIVNVTPQPLLRVQEEKDESDPSANTKTTSGSKIVSNLKMAMAYKSNDTTLISEINNNGRAPTTTTATNVAKEAYTEESKYDIKNDQTPVSITSNNNKVKTSNSTERIFDSSQNDHLTRSKEQGDEENDMFKARGSKNDQIVFPTQSSSYYNDVNKRFHMTQSQEGLITDLEPHEDRHQQRLSSAEVIVINDESLEQNSKNDSDFYNPFRREELAEANHVNQITKFSQSDEENNAIQVVPKPTSTFYDGSKVWTTTLTEK